MARVEISGLGYAIGSHQILSDVSLEVEEGSCLALLGPSGCGKTSTLRAVAGFVHPTAGSITIGGRAMRGLPPHRRNIGLVFQDYALFPHMTVAQNVAYGLRRRSVPSPEIAERVRAALGAVRLDGFGERMPAQLSGGQQQRVALARALIIRPDVLLLDEPLGALDRKLRDEMQIELKRIQRESAVTTIIVTHDQEEALSLADRVAVMFDGRIAQVASPIEVYRAPASRRVMEFLGETNMLDGVAVPGGVSLRQGVVISSALGSAPGAAVRLAIRPERITLFPPGRTALSGAVRQVVYKGPHADVFVALGDGQEVLVRWGETADLPLAELHPGANVSIAIPPDAAVIFEEAQ